MRRMLALVIVLFTAALCNSTNAAADTSCPNLWNEKLPPLTFQKTTVINQDVNMDYLATNFGGIDNVSIGIKGGRDSSDSRNNAAFRLPVTAPDLFARISALGRDVVWSTEYSYVTPSKYKSPFLFESKMESRYLRYIGISDGSEVTFKLKVEVKNCAPFVFESNRAAVPPLDTKELTLPKYFDSFYPDWNYVQIQNLTNHINSGVEATKGAKVNQRVPMKQITGYELYSPLFVGVSPGGCVDSIGSSIPAHNPEHLIFNSLPCTVGVYMGGQFKDKSYGSPLVSTFTVSGPTAEETKAAADLKAKQDADVKAAAELKAKQEAAVKAAAELKAKQDADAKAAAELKAKQDAEAKAAADVKAAAELKAKQEAAVKAAAELKAKQDADAKAAAELKAKQDAEAKAAADKAALVRAQSELTAANAALADSQKINREQAAKISSLEEQFKVLSESVATVQNQLSQLNSKLVAALAGQNAANAKLKKVCSAKPKPKGC
jgi:hypothetical protein